MAANDAASSRAGRAPATGFGWTVRPTLGFVGVLVLFAAAGLWPRWARTPRPTGLPADPAIQQAQALLPSPLPVAGAELRLRCELIAGGNEPAPEARRAELSADELARVSAAVRYLEAALVRAKGDPRVECALAHLDLAARRLERAAARYRAVLDRTPRYGEARLGLGVALALTADTYGGEPRAQRLRLEAIAHFAAVEEDDPCALQALYDRAWLLSRAGRREEARLWSARYLAHDPASPWAAALAGAIEQPRP